MKNIYLDNAAGTPVDPGVIDAMAAAACVVGNPSAFNDAGRDAARVMKKARETVARFLNAHEREIIFCASGSEANTLAIMGIADASDAKHRHIITTPIEHLSVLQPVRGLVKRGWSVSYVPVNRAGLVTADDVMHAVRPGTALVSVMYANNEIGTVEPIAKIGRAISEWRRAHGTRLPLFHVDACQAAAYLDMDVQRLGADSLTFNGSKVYGPRGSAVLYVRRGIRLAPQVLGGEQEGGRRAGTENIPAIVGLTRAISGLRVRDAVRVAGLRDYVLKKLPREVPDAHPNGPFEGRLANNINFSIPGIQSEVLLLELDKHGISAGSGSACTAHSVEPSHVLRAVGTPKKYLDGVLRISLSKYTTKMELDRVLEVLPGGGTKGACATLEVGDFLC